MLYNIASVVQSISCNSLYHTTPNHAKGAYSLKWNIILQEKGVPSNRHIPWMVKRGSIMKQLKKKIISCHYIVEDCSTVNCTIHLCQNRISVYTRYSFISINFKSVKVRYEPDVLRISTIKGIGWS